MHPRQLGSRGGGGGGGGGFGAAAAAASRAAAAARAAEAPRGRGDAAQPGSSTGIDLDRVEAAIRTAERAHLGRDPGGAWRASTSGATSAAPPSAAFARLGMHRTRQRNGVLLFVAPRRRRFAVVGDAGIHQRVTEAFWNQISRRSEPSFTRGDLTAGLEHAIAAIGERLAEHFPPDPHDTNELPDRVEIRALSQARGLERGQDDARRGGLVQRVEVDAGRAAVEQLDGLGGGLRDAERERRRLVVAAAFELGLQRRRDGWRRTAWSCARCPRRCGSA